MTSTRLVPATAGGSGACTTSKLLPWLLSRSSSVVPRLTRVAAARPRVGPYATSVVTSDGAELAVPENAQALLRAWRGRHLLPAEWADDVAATYLTLCLELAERRTGLERCFFLDDTDRALVDRRRRDSHRRGFAVALGTVRFLGTFVPDLDGVPPEVVSYMANGLSIEDPSCLDAYSERPRRGLRAAVGRLGRPRGR